MFERLAGKVLSSILSKYFSEDSLARNKVSTSAQLGVWSGYVSLENLELKKDVINEVLRRKGQPFEIIHSTFRRVEITVPWSKLTGSTRSAVKDDDQEDAVVVVVIDGIHLLARSNFTFDDDALRRNEIKKRREKLAEVASFGKIPQTEDDTIGLTYTEIIKKRIKDSLFREMVDKLQLHLRDMHIRLEDIESDPQNPFACGVTMESMHIQHDDRGCDDGVVRKVAHLNHFAIYWNALEYGDAVPAEHSVMQEAFCDPPERLSRALDISITRRASAMASPSKNPYIPTNTFLLLPVDGILKWSQSENPDDLTSTPALAMDMDIDAFSVQIRDFQCMQIVGFVNAFKNHNFTKKYRTMRPSTKVKDNPRLWWRYATRVILFQLKEKYLRWSWSRFQQRYQIRGRYIELFERKIRHDHLERIKGTMNESDAKDYEMLEDKALIDATPDDAAGPSVSKLQFQSSFALGQSELTELKNLEDGVHGDLSINDIILFRAVVNMRLGRDLSPNGNSMQPRSSWWRSTVEDVAIDDSEAKEEFERLMAFLDRSKSDVSGVDNENKGSQTAISIVCRLGEGCLAFFSPLKSTSDQTQLRRLHERFLELVVTDLRIGHALMGDYESSTLNVTLVNVMGKEVRTDRSHHLVVRKASNMFSDSPPTRAEPRIENSSVQNPFFVFSLVNDASKSRDCDVELVMFVDKLDILFVPDCQWILKTKQLLQNVSTMPSARDFWGNLAMAYFNSLASGRLGLKAKAKSAGFKHKNMDLDITLQCPFLRIGNGSDSFLVIDLGIAHLKTEKLAGVAQTKLNGQPQLEDSDTTFHASFDEISESSPSTLRKMVVRPFYRSSVISIDSRAQRSLQGSMYFDDQMTFNPTDPVTGAGAADGIHAFFYDVYQLCLITGKVTMETAGEPAREITTGLEVRTTIEKSVIPADHTLCRLKAHSTVGEFSLILSGSIILSLANLVDRWKAVLAGEALSQLAPVMQQYSSSSADLMAGVKPSMSMMSLASEDFDDALLSQVDEQEFFDANDGYDSFSAEQSGVWFEDTWISDAASFIDADSRHSRDRRSRRRHQSSVVSDVSSVSDQSAKGRRGHGNAYLSAENLARLEEGAGEDDSVAESGADIENDSFHSAMSTGGRMGLARELEEDIEKAEDKITRLKEKLAELSQAINSTKPPKLKEMKRRRTLKKSIKLELDRSMAELSALRALYCDLQSQPVEVAQNNDKESLPPDVRSRRSTTTTEASQSVRRTKALLAAKKKHDMNVGNDGVHRMTRDLNPKLFEGSVLFSKLKVKIQLEETTNAGSSSRVNAPVFEVCAAQTGVALFHCSSDTKVYFGIENITAAITSDEDSGSSPRLLFVGGTIDALLDNQLPVHFPQFIARSMEEKLVRGALYHRRRLTDEYDSPSETFKLRLVLGDMEFTPRGEYLTVLIAAFFKLQKSLSPSTVRGSSTDESENIQSSRSNGSSGLSSRGNKRSVRFDASSITVKPSPTKYYDLAVRCTSIRLALCHENQIVGACTIAETNTRCVHVSSRCTHKSRSQIDLRCSNFQVLHITSLEEGKGIEILGRSDPYTHLINLRLRRQLVSSSEVGGWVVGLDNAPTEAETVVSTRTIWNLHLGVKISPIVVVAAPRALRDVADSVRELKSVIRRRDTNLDVQVEMTDSHQTHQVPKELQLPSRWRLDFSLRRVFLNFPSETKKDYTGFDSIGQSFSMSLSSLVSLEKSALPQEALCLRVALADVSLSKSPDDWPILDPFSVMSEMCLVLKPGISRSIEKPNLRLPVDSPWNEISAFMHRQGWDVMPEGPTENLHMSLALKVTPIRVNLSASLCGLIVNHAKTFRSLLLKKEDEALSTRECSPTDISVSKKFWLHVALAEVEIKLLRGAASKPISFAEQLVSLTLTDVTTTYERENAVTVSVLIRESSLFDLSTSPGVRVLGEDPLDESEEGSSERPHFVRVKFELENSKDGPRMIRLQINWGKIQCLVLPSLIRSLLNFYEALKSLLGSQSNADNPKSNGDDAVRKLLKSHDDVNFVMSADAESFECILSSKDIGSYVRDQSPEPIGVVTFRWKAALNVTLALDGLRGSSRPWLTLNPNDEFTDSPDVDLFKDFCNRYLDQSSGFIAGSDEVGYKLVNAFTAKVELRVSDFQALRTNISSPQLESSVLVAPNYKSEPRIYFKVHAPLAGERRITNSMDVAFTYRLAGASMSCVNEDGVSDPRVEISQLFELEAKFVDVLVYISQSTRGATAAFRVTVKPVLDMLKRKEDREPPKPSPTTEENDKKKGLLSLIGRASTICTVRAEGFQVTCVPGGATQLTESPIIKFELSNVSFGLAAVPVPKDVKLMTESSVDTTGASKPLISGFDMMHLTAAGWMNCEVSAEYHNRRLVAWEPFIEPWMVDMRFGADLVEVFDIQPTMKSQITPWEPPSDSIQSDFSVLNPATINERAGERLRDIGRLFRVPFRSATSTKPAQSGPISNEFMSHPDFCYMMLASSARMTIASVMYPSLVQGSETQASVFSSFPGHRPVDWLYGFGFPQASAQDGGNPNPQYSVSCLVSDVRPLNINLTGALIENVLGYLDRSKREAYRTVAPHWIRNDSGMTIRIQEVLDADRIRRGEKAGKVTLSNGSEVPLTLKRSRSQSCDPHRGYIMVELGSFEDTVGRVNQDDYIIPKGSRSSSFVYKAVAKIPVDTVGVHRYPLDRNIEKRADLQALGTDSRAVGWIIVRVALKGGIKMVSVESPCVLKSNADADLLCEIRDHNGLSLLWRCLVPKSGGEDGSTTNSQSMVSVPADIVPFIHDGSFVFSVMSLCRDSSFTHETELLSIDRDGAVEVPTPPPFSPTSFGKGLIDEKEIGLIPLSQTDGLPSEEDVDRSKKVHLSVCSLRIGSFSGVNLGVKPTVDIPEQRMVFFRSPLVIRNYLALPISIQVRVKTLTRPVKRYDSSVPGSSRNSKEANLSRQTTSIVDWEDLGILDCGQSVNWTGALSTDKVEMRVKFAGVDSEHSRTFPTWSTGLTIPAREKGGSSNIRSSNSDGTSFSQMRVFDASNVPLRLSVSVGGGAGDSDPATYDNIRLFSQNFAPAPRVISIFVPYWIVDGTGQDLDFSTGGAVAGQLSNRIPGESNGYDQQKTGVTMGLAELLEDDKLMHLPSRSAFEVIMIGDERATRLTVRRQARQRGNLTRRENVSPWSDPIPLQSEQASQHEVTVLSTAESSKPGDAIDSRDASHAYQYAFRSSIVFAPERFGGNLGTKLIHIVNRYMIVNETGRDIEIAAEYGNVIPVLVKAGCRPQPFHFDDTSQIRFRFKEFGWSWSGNFHIRANRREVTLRVRHKMKAYTLIATVESHAPEKSATRLVVFRLATNPPFRLENHTMYPLHFGQSAWRMGAEDSALDSMLLPYQSADFAWDEPDVRRRAVVVKAASSTDLANPVDTILGRFYLDRIAPGTVVRLESTIFKGEVVADGPTRVFRVSDASMPRLPSFRQDERNEFHQKPEISSVLSVSLIVKFSHGFGVSVVDWSPQELLYARFDGIQLERKMDMNKDVVSLSIGNIVFNNQMWVTPYPVFLKMGRRSDSHTARRRNRRHNAVFLSWSRSVNTHGGYGNSTLLESVELSSGPLFINADGNLADLLGRMGRQASETSAKEVRNLTESSRDSELRKILQISEEVAPEETASPRKKLLATCDWGPDGDFSLTSAIAAKLKTRPPVASPAHMLLTGRSTSVLRERDKAVSLSKPRHKYYIEKLRISGAKAELSWSGPLPRAFSSLLLQALTFEGLPVRFSPFSSSHAYGTAEDHVQSLKSHYFSFWRVFDLLMGLSYNPTFLLRAVVYTCRESVASMLDSCSRGFKSAADGALDLVPTEGNLQPTYDDGLLVVRSLSPYLVLKRALIRPFIMPTVYVLRRWESMNSWGSSQLRYGPEQDSGTHRSTSGLVRSRTPRLFAHVDGKDLLVEYVEGQNAGNALLSRVRRGVHLGEGYIFHTEGAQQRTKKDMSPERMDSAPLIFMMTSERVLLLNGKLDSNFCSVVWEAMFENIVHVEVTVMGVPSTHSFVDLVEIWYLSSPGLASGSSDDIMARYTKAVIGSYFGINVLHSKAVFVPYETGTQLLSKMGTIDKSLVENFHY